MTEPRLASRLLAYLRAGNDVDDRAVILARGGVALALCGSASDLSPAEKEALLNASRPLVVATLRAQAAAAEVRDALITAGVRHVPMKGPVLAATWERGWAQETARTYGDADVLVDEDDVALAIEALAANPSAYRGPESVGQLTVPLGPRTALDLHWTIVNDTAWIERFLLQTPRILQDYVTWDGVEGQLDPEFSLIHTAVHALLSDLSRPAALFDIDGCARHPDLDWARFDRLVQRHGLQLPIAVALTKARHWLDSPIPADLLQGLAGRSPWLMLCTLVQRRDPAKYLTSGWSGGELFRLTRANTVDSAMHLLRSVPLEVRTQRRIRHGN